MANPPANSPTQSPSPAKSPASAAAEPAALVADEHPDEDHYDFGIDVTAESDTTSLKSSLLKYREENGRTYHAYKDGSYVLPNDDAENERLDLQHTILLLTFDSRLHIAPLDKPPNRVLDAGCGTGIWTIEFADEYPASQVTGVDLSPIQPAFVPPNASFFIDDFEEDWNFSAPFDYIFARMLTGSVRDWPRFFRQSYENLNPGGTFEIHDVLYPMESDDGTLKPENALDRWSKLMIEAFRGFGQPVDSALRYEQQLTEVGFVDVVVVKEKWPTNRWPRDQKYKQIGLWNVENLANALGAVSLAVLTRPTSEKGLGWSREEVEVLLADVRKDLRNTNIHAYFPIRAVYARKPE